VDLLEEYARAGVAAGCPRDQIENFMAGGYVATPKGLEFHALARKADNADGPVQIGDGGARGGGKSHTTFAQVVHDDSMRMPGLKTLFLRSVGKAARESFEDLITKVCPQYRSGYKPGLSKLQLANGSMILFGGFRSEGDIDKYLGIEYDVIVPEEVNLLTYMKHTQLRGSLRTSKENWRPRSYPTFNPGGVGHGWVKRTFIEPWRKGTETDTAFVFTTYLDNPFIDDAYKKYLEGLTGWLGRAWRDGDWDIAAGQFFTTWRHAEVVKEFVPSPYWRYWLSMDYGFQHYTVVYLFAEDGDGNLYVVDEHARRQWLPSRHAGAIRAMTSRHPCRYWDVFVAGADVFAKRGEATVADQYKALGLELTAAQMDRINGAAEILKRLGDPDAGIAPTVTIHPRCVGLIECLPIMEHDPRRPEDVLKVDCDSEGNGGDDTYDAFRYGVLEGAHKYSPPGVIKYA